MAGSDSVWDPQFFSNAQEKPPTLPAEMNTTLVQTEILNSLGSLSQKVDRMNAVAPTSGSEKAAADLANCEEIIRNTIRVRPQFLNQSATNQADDFQKKVVEYIPPAYK